MAELLITHPPTYEPERRYVYDVMFGEFLGVSYREMIGDDLDTTEISLCGDSSGKRLILHEALFTIARDKWLTEDSLPRQPLDRWMLPDVVCDIAKTASEISVIYGQPIMKDSYYAECDGDIQLGLDIFGTAFFMLTRYEEVVKSDRDEHDRFPAAASLAYQEGFLERPIVNEYLEILWMCMKRLWPRLQRKQRQYQVRVSHDVDHPFAVVGRPLTQVVRNSIGDVVIRKDLGLMTRRLGVLLRGSANHCDLDPNNTFDFIMDVSEEHDLQSAFYFMATDRRGEYDEGYSLDYLWIRQLLKKIALRGHELGFHASYHASDHEEQLKSEVHRLRDVLESERIFDGRMGGRQHYLRWRASSTWRSWNRAGLDYDGSVGFADHVGFRAGTCYEYPTYDFANRTSMTLRERPLVVMECTVFEREYMGMTDEAGLDHIAHVGNACRKYDGQLTLLWHNSYLLTSKQKRLYRRILDTITRK